MRMARPNVYKYIIIAVQHNIGLWLLDGMCCVKKNRFFFLPRPFSPAAATWNTLIITYNIMVYDDVQYGQS